MGLKKIPFADDTTEWGAVCVLTALTLQNFLTIDIIWLIFTGKFLFPILDRIETVILLGIFFMSHYFLFIHKHRYEDIIEQFKNESIEKREKGNRYTVVYIAGSVVLFFSLNIIKLIIYGKP